MLGTSVLACLLAAAGGCAMCASPYDYCGPTFTGGGCAVDTCGSCSPGGCGGCAEGGCGGCGDPCYVNERVGSNLSGGYWPAALGGEPYYDGYGPDPMPTTMPIPRDEPIPYEPETLPPPPIPLSTDAGNRTPLMLRR